MVRVSQEEDQGEEGENSRVQLKFIEVYLLVKVIKLGKGKGKGITTVK